MRDLEITEEWLQSNTATKTHLALPDALQDEVAMDSVSPLGNLSTR